MDLQMLEALVGLPLQPIHSCLMADAQDLERLRDLSAKYASLKASNSWNGVNVTKEKKENFAEDKENFLMPAPKMPVRSGVRKRKTKDVNDAIITPLGNRVTRSSRMTGVLCEDVCMTDKPARSRATRSTQVLSPDRGLNKTSVICDSDSSMDEESKKSRRGTNTVEEAAPRASRRGTRVRASSRVGARASTRASTRASSRQTSHAASKLNGSVLKAKESVRPTRATRAGSGKVALVVDSEENVLKSPSDPQHSKKTMRQKSLFSPYSQNSVKERVEAFEGLSSSGSIEKRGKTKDAAQKSEMVNGSSEDVPSEEAVKISPMVLKSKALKRVDSPVTKGKKKLSYKKAEAVIIKEEADADSSAMEVEEMDVMVEELLKTSHADEEMSSAKQSKGNKNDCTYNLNEDSYKKDEENEADDEWMTDDEDKPSGKKKEGISDNYRTPKQKASSTSKLAQEVLGSYKALRNRKVNKASSEMSLALNSKGKTTPVISKSVTNLATIPSKQIECEIKEAEHKRQQEKEMEAIKRKEELLKKRTEAAKKKREEKMSKVKRTREEKEKELEAKKAKKAKMPAKKKKLKEAEPEVLDKKSPKPVSTPKDQTQLNSTYTMPEGEENNAYNMTPHWADVSPKQPVNPNDYGVVDKSDCSSEEENDPRKKVPLWTKQIRSHLLCQSFITASIMHDYWQTKPRALNIQELFGTKVSKNTLKRGLHYRTSSAIWHTPPVKM